MKNFLSGLLNIRNKFMIMKSLANITIRFTCKSHIFCDIIYLHELRLGSYIFLGYQFTNSRLPIQIYLRVFFFFFLKIQEDREVDFSQRKVFVQMIKIRYIQLFSKYDNAIFCETDGKSKQTIFQIFSLKIFNRRSKNIMYLSTYQ